MENKKGKSKSDLVFESISCNDDLELPRNKTERRLFGRFIDEASEAIPLGICVGSCPDYSNDGLRYTHEHLGSGVPLLTRVHIDGELDLIKTLEKYDVPYCYMVLVADVEALDDVFCARYTNGDRNAFLARCRESVSASTKFLSQVKLDNGFRGEFIAGNFTDNFGGEFLDLYKEYQTMLLGRMSDDGRLNSRISTNTADRMNLYYRVYPEIARRYRGQYRELSDFFKGRTVRTMAQYLALGRCIANIVNNPVVICHKTTNIGLFNDRNRYPLPQDNQRKLPHPTMPVLTLNKTVY